MNKLQISTQLTLEDFKRLSFHLLYRNSAIKILTGFGILLLICVFLLFFLMRMEHFSIGGLFIGLGFIFLLPILTFVNAKKNYNSNHQFSEKMTYEFDAVEMKIQGESFYSTLTWDKLHKITESKDFILIWQRNQTANALPKRDFTTDELRTFKDIIKKVEGLDFKFK